MTKLLCPFDLLVAGRPDMLALGSSRSILRHYAYQFVGDIPFLQIGHFIGCQSQINRFRRIFNMVRLGSAHYRRGNLGQQPGKGNLRHGHTPFFRQLGHTVNNHGVLFDSSIILEFGIAVFFQPFRSFTRMFGKGVRQPGRCTGSAMLSSAHNLAISHAPLPGRSGCNGPE